MAERLRWASSRSKGGQPGLMMVMRPAAVIAKLNGLLPILMLEDAAISLMQGMKGCAQSHSAFWMESLSAVDVTHMNSQGHIFTPETWEFKVPCWIRYIVSAPVTRNFRPVHPRCVAAWDSPLDLMICV